MENNEQLDYMNNNSTSIHVGKRIEGQILNIVNDEIYVGIPGYKKDGIIPKNEVYIETDKEINEVYNVGDTIEVKVLSLSNSDGYVILSNLEIVKESSKRELIKKYENNEPIEVKVDQVIKGGIIARYNGIQIFVPASHIDLNRIDDLSKFIGKDIIVKIIEYKEERYKTRIVGSRRVILEAEKEQREKEALESLNVGDIVKGEVKNIVDYGAFVDINGIEGLIHVSEIGWGKVKIKNLFKVGDVIDVKVISIDNEKRKVSLSVKALTEDPWTNIEEKYPVGNITMGKVVRFTDFGAFVELEPGVDALLHISKISNQRINHPSEALKIGEIVKAVIIDVNSEKKRISLNMKEI